MKVKLKSFEKEKTTEKIMNTDEPAQKQETSALDFPMDLFPGSRPQYGFAHGLHPVDNPSNWYVAILTNLTLDCFVDSAPGNMTYLL
ncbi:hypothetical protein Y1Q_0008093 [Alligator mississippiensis]|uniref:Uncharacterized protein n=1 Tax=Alligator mississippiensis TaxID=8496 RepID=A0A151NFH3_ALLMI|nr:hypothetical protein Y1Q_0008093 [Alligator mississippiensis]